MIDPIAIILGEWSQQLNFYSILFRIFRLSVLLL